MQIFHFAHFNQNPQRNTNRTNQSPLTCEQASGSPTSSPAGHQSSSGGGQRLGRSGAPCRWCPALRWRSGRFCSARICTGCRPWWEMIGVSKYLPLTLNLTKCERRKKSLPLLTAFCLPLKSRLEAEFNVTFIFSKPQDATYRHVSLLI